MAKLTIKDLLEAGVHFGHQRKRWNPKMREYVYGFKNGISIIDLTKTMRQLADAINFLQHKVEKGGKILFVGTKRQAQQVIKDAAEKTGMFYVTDRWLGGTLTNNVTIRQSVKKMEKIDAILNSPSVSGMKKKELASLRRQSFRLHRNLDGIYEMTKLPDVLFVVDVSKEYIAVNEARKLNIPIVAIVDTDSDPEPIDYPIPSNDDAVRSIGIIVDVITEAIKEVADIYNKKVEEESAEKAKSKKAKPAKPVDKKKTAVKKEEKTEIVADEKKEETEKSTEVKKEPEVKEEKEKQTEEQEQKAKEAAEEVKDKEETSGTEDKAEKAEKEEAKGKKKAATKRKTTTRKKKTTTKDKEESGKEEETKEKKKTVRKRRTTKKETKKETEDKAEKIKEEDKKTEE